MHNLLLMSRMDCMLMSTSYMGMSTCYTHLGNILHYSITSLPGKAWAITETNLTPPYFIEVPVPSQENERPCI